MTNVLTRQAVLINILSFAYIWQDKGNQNEFLKHPKIKPFNFRMLKEFVLISFILPDVRKTLNIINLWHVITGSIKLLGI